MTADLDKYLGPQDRNPHPTSFWWVLGAFLVLAAVLTFTHGFLG